MKKQINKNKFKTNLKHGLSKTPEYRVWSNMLSRCNNKNNPRFERYGGRGIEVCEEWNNFENFINDMGFRPSPDYSIERINNDDNYCKDNCKWATKLEQAKNRSYSKRL